MTTVIEKRKQNHVTSRTRDGLLLIQNEEVNEVVDLFKCDINVLLLTYTQSIKTLKTDTNMKCFSTGGGWGFKFSASASYKESVAQMSSGEFLYIISQAQCRYYFSKLDATDPPPFHPGFVTWAKKLASSNAGQDDLVQFIEYFGTHYVSEVTFGARFMKQHRVSQTKYKELREKSVSVEAQASYSGMFSVGGGFSLDSEQRSAASNFQKSVETSTITVGAAPPSNGDAMTWASSVQENPVPTKYSLSPVYDLFTERYAEYLPGIDLNAMREKLINTSRNYCRILRGKGEIDSCDDSINLGTTLQGVDVSSFGKYYH